MCAHVVAKEDTWVFIRMTMYIQVGMAGHEGLSRFYQVIVLKSDMGRLSW